ncbi:MAG: hypothetical protein KTR25_18080 [Myxococcales bacterium]|nr:hypothetical protein [Myxococcales bacterium]
MILFALQIVSPQFERADDVLIALSADDMLIALSEVDVLFRGVAMGMASAHV